jgi:glucosamine-6-phosphate deaminase
MKEHFFRHINIQPENTHIPNGLADEMEECVRYDRLIRRLGGIDMQLLGLGHNGHIGFNEPGASFDKDTHCVSLTESTIEANRRFFERPEDVPRQAYTMGIRSIMQARRILVVASGADKARIVKDAFFGPVTPLVPASVLQLHNNVTLAGDEDALSMI